MYVFKHIEIHRKQILFLSFLKLFIYGTLLDKLKWFSVNDFESDIYRTHLFINASKMKHLSYRIINSNIIPINLYLGWTHNYFITNYTRMWTKITQGNIFKINRRSIFCLLVYTYKSKNKESLYIYIFFIKAVNHCDVLSRYVVFVLQTFKKFNSSCFFSIWSI